MREAAEDLPGIVDSEGGGITMAERKCNRAGCERRDYYVCNKCGYIGVSQEDHQNSSHGRVCNYEAPRTGEWVTHNSLDYHAVCAVMVLEEKLKKLQGSYSDMERMVWEELPLANYEEVPGYGPDGLPA